MDAVNPLVMYARANDGEAIDQANILQLKENFVRAEMRAREETFTEKSKLKIFCGTWNVNGKRPPDSLVDWLGLQRDSPPDVVAVGFQELDLTPEALLLGDTSRSAPWEQMILSTLNTIDSYYLIKSRQLVGMLLCVYVKTALLPKVSDVRTAAAGVGIMGMMGNKGGVGIRFNIYDSSICIVNSHLSAHQEQFQRRNQDFHEICKRVTFENPYGASVTTIFEHDYLFWVGDLNYRLNLPDAEIKSLIKESKWDQLLQSDQLTIQMQQGNVFKNFFEARIAFIPTYKYDPGTNTFDTSEKRRSPAWCDRVLWKGSNVEVLEYRRHEQLSSDHRPVSLTTLVQVKNIIQEKRQQVYQEVVKELDKMENQIIPDATLSANDVSFEDVRYGIACSQTVILENTGHVRVRFRFIPKPGEARMTKQWLNVNPPFGTAVPGERIKLELTVLVDEVSAPGLNFGSETLSDILILHLDGGKHYYLHVRGNYLPSCFGSSLEFLVRNPLPIRANSPLAVDNKQVLSIPKELWQIVDFLYKNGMETVHLFLESGVASEMDSIRECLDTGVPLDDYTGTIYSMGESLIRFLESLVEPVIPFSMYNRCIEASGSFTECKQLLSYLSTVNYNVFFYLMAFLREVLNCSPKNRLAPNKLAVVFSTVLIRPPTTDFNETMAKKKAKVDFISYFLRPEDELRLPQ